MGSPLMRKRAPRGFAAATFAPALLRSSPTTKSNPKFVVAGVEKFFRSGDHRGDDAFRVARPAPPNKFRVFERRKERRHGIHVRGKRDDGLAPAAKILSRFGSTAIRSSRPEVRAARNDSWANKKSATCFSWLVVDSISTSARVVRKDSFGPIISGGSETKGRNREEMARGCCLSIALHPALALAATPPSKRMTVDRP